MLALALGGLAGCGTSRGARAARPAAARIVPAPGPQVTIIQSRGRFLPKTLQIEPGTTVRFENRDRVFHKAFSVSPARPFDLGSMAPGKSRTLRFDHPGTVQVYCELHPREVATIVVSSERPRLGASSGL